MLEKIAKLLFGSVSAKILQFVFFFWVAKLLDRDQFGQYAVSMTLFLILMYPLLEFGSELLINREEAKGNRGYFFQIVYWKLLAFPVVALLGILSGRLFFDLELRILIPSAVFVLLKSLENGNAASLRGRNRTEIESAHLICSRTLSIILLTATNLLAPAMLSIEIVIWFQVIGVFVSILVIEKRYLLDIALPALNIKALQGILRLGLPLALNSIAWLIYFKIDVLLISQLVDSANAGTYEIAYKIMEATFVLPGVMMAVIFRQLVGQQTVGQRTQKGRNSLFYKTLLTLGGVGTLVATASVLILPYLFPLLFKQHLQALDVFNLLAMAIPIIYMAHLTTQTLVVQNQNYVYLGITLSGAVLNLALNLYFIRSFGISGAAIATVITEAFILLSSGYFVLRH